MEYLVVALMFVVFLQTRIMDLRRAVYCLGVQSAIIAAACLVIGMSHGGGLHAFLPGVLTIAVKVIFIPYAILKVVRNLQDESEIVSDINVNYSTAVAACALALSYMVFDSLLPHFEGYCQFIQEYVKNHGISKLLFLFRDGDIIKKVYENL